MRVTTTNFLLNHLFLSACPLNTNLSSKFGYHITMKKKCSKIINVFELCSSISSFFFSKLWRDRPINLTDLYLAVCTMSGMIIYIQVTERTCKLLQIVEYLTILCHEIKRLQIERWNSFHIIFRYDPAPSENKWVEKHYPRLLCNTNIIITPLFDAFIF